MPWQQLQQVMAVIQYGKDKYGAYNWTHLKQPRERYFAACMRHMLAWQKGELRDKESGLPHLAHAATNMLFLMWFDRGIKAGEVMLVDDPKTFEVNLKEGTRYVAC